MPEFSAEHSPINFEMGRHSPSQEILNITGECINGNIEPQAAFAQIIESTDKLEILTHQKVAEEEESKTLELDNFRASLNLDSQEINQRNETRRQGLEEKYAKERKATYNYTECEVGLLENNIEKLSQRQTAFQIVKENLSPIQKQLLKMERRKVISELNKNGIADAEALVKSMEDSASRFIFNPYLAKRKISYKKLLSNNNKPISLVNVLSNDYSADNYDIVRKIEVRFSQPSFQADDYEKLSKFSDILKLDPSDFDQYMAVESHHPNARWTSPDNREYIVNKIKSKTLSSEDLAKLDCSLKLSTFNKSADLRSDFSDLETNLKIYESFYLQETSIYWPKTNEYYNLLQNIVLKTCTSEDKQNIKSIIDCGIDINSDYCYGQDNADLKADSKLIVDSLNSEYGPYLKTMIDLFDRPDLKSITVLAKDIEYFKSADGVKFLKLIKDIPPGYVREYLMSVNRGIVSDIDKDGNCSDKLLEKIFKEGFNHRDELAEFLIRPEKITSLADNDQKFWKTFAKTVNQEKNTNYMYFIFENRANFGLYFDSFGQPTSLLLTSYLKSNKSSDYDWYENAVLRSVSDPDTLKSFSESEKKFWKKYQKIFQTNPKAYKVRSFLLDHQDKFNSYFDMDGQPTFYLLESLLKENEEKGQPLIDYVAKAAENLPELDRNYILTLGFFKDNALRQCLLENKKDFDNKNLEVFLPIIKEASVNKAGAIFGEIVQSQYVDGDNRLLPSIGLCAWRHFNDYLSSSHIDFRNLSQDDYGKILVESQQEIDKRIKRISALELDLPEGLRVSVGTEIEVVLNGIFKTGAVSKEEIVDYKKSAEKLQLRPSAFIEEYLNDLSHKIGEAKRLYREQVNYVDYLGVGRGNDAVHEFANAPVTNTSVLLWELYEISRLGFIDFDRKLLQYTERGMHLTISGDKNGIKLDENAHLLQSALLSTGWSTDALDAVGSSEIVDSVTDDSKKLYKQVKGFILERVHVKKPLFDNADTARGVENRAVRINSFNHLARTIDTFYRLAIPLKAYQDFIEAYGRDRSQKLLLDVESGLNSNQDLNGLNSESEKLLPEVKDEKLRKSIIAWAYFRNATVKNFAEKQKNISQYKLKSPLEEYNGRDMTRLGSELFKVFGGIADDGTKLDDALLAYHQIPEIDSLPEVERKLIGQVRKEIGTLFRKRR
jgi:hypothetical protein